MYEIAVQFVIAVVAGLFTQWIAGLIGKRHLRERFLIASLSAVAALAVLFPLFSAARYWLFDEPLSDGRLLAASVSPLVLFFVGTATYYLRGASERNSAVLRRDIGKFRRRLEALISDEHLRERVMAARQAVQDVASFLDRRWERGRHTLAGASVQPIRVAPHGRESTRLALDVQDIIMERLNQSIAGACSIESDEGGLVQSVEDTNHTWVIDPIDGSRHLMRHLPLFTTTIALVDREYQPILAMVYVPVSGELFFAVRGHGAYLNNWDTRLDLSQGAREQMYGYVEFPNVDSSEREFVEGCRFLEQIFKSVYRVRGCGLGSLGMAYVAKGAFDAYITLPGTTRRCDVLAGVLLVTEANGRARVVDARGRTAQVPASLSEVFAIGANTRAYDAFMEIGGIAELFPNQEDS